MIKQRKPPKQPRNPNERSDNSTFLDHIRELRRRVLWVALVFGITSAVAYQYHDALVKAVMMPLDGEKLIYLTPGGGFSFIFQITLYAGIIAAGPALMYQIYKFVQPTLPQRARRSALKVACFATLLMIAGVSYGYFVAVPAALTFLSNFAGSEIIPNLTADSYLSFFLAYIGGLALLFQLPLVLIFWHWIKPMKPGGLLKSERLIILFAFIVAALITPTPDVVNQAMIAVPLIVIYQIGVIAVLLSILKTRRKQKDQRAISSASIAPPAAPVVKPAITPRLAAVPVSVASPSSQKRPPARSVDGFGSRTKKFTPPTTRPLTVPSRPLPKTTLVRRRSLSIDGMSPL